MARPIPGSNLSMQKLSFLPGPITFLIVFASVFSVFSLVTFLCGSHGGLVKSLSRKEGKKTVRLGGEKKPVIEKMKSGLSSKALLMAKMVSWRKVQDEGETEDFHYAEEEEDRDGVVWKKTIIKGEKCKPLEFSGKILYDADGNLLPD
ncbi:hypothetical protein PHJA_000026200 [Phtheirospermum japonicum]|uniref:Transmembrane protein n=1 Tax=Phtheirospermum japonicum TaxID=374723 RepID=A0A830AWZ1_9LAMI|nr:hypothetical protein PHJA_000026200 [Phtheirospermum japonicum]